MLLTYHAFYEDKNNDLAGLMQTLK